MMKLLGLIMKRPSDSQIRIAKIVLGIMLILTGIAAFNLQNLSLEESILGIALDANTKVYVSYFIIGLWAIPLVLWGLDINVLSRGRTRILQVLFWVLLFIISGAFVETPTLSVDIFYFLLGLVVFFAGITGKAITKKWLKTGQTITKIRV